MTNIFNFLKKNKLRSDDNIESTNNDINVWEKELVSEILPESNFYYSMSESFNSNFVNEKVISTTMPSFSVKRYFQEALYLTFANFDKEVSTAYLQTTLDIANAILTLPQSEIERWNGEDIYVEIDKPNILSNKLFIEAILANDSIDTDELMNLNNSLLNYLKKYKGSLWEDVTQSNYLVCVWNLIIAGQFQDAKMHLNVKKKFSYVEGLFNWTVQINTLLIAQQSGDRVKTELTQLFDEVFNIIRLPKWNTIDHQDKDNLTITMSADYVRFQLAVIRWLYIEKQPLKNHWTEVLAQVSK